MLQAPALENSIILVYLKRFLSRHHFYPTIFPYETLEPTNIHIGKLLKPETSRGSPKKRMYIFLFLPKFFQKLLSSSKALEFYLIFVQCKGAMQLVHPETCWKFQVRNNRHFWFILIVFWATLFLAVDIFLIKSSSGKNAYRWASKADNKKCAALKHTCKMLMFYKNFSKSVGRFFSKNVKSLKKSPNLHNFELVELNSWAKKSFQNMSIFSKIIKFVQRFWFSIGPLWLYYRRCKFQVST